MKIKKLTQILQNISLNPFYQAKEIITKNILEKQKNMMINGLLK